MSNTIVFEPYGERGRVDALDVARGIAILGTLWTNIWVFSHPAGLAGMLFEPIGTPAELSPGETAQITIVALSQGKFLALLSLLFGMGVAIQRRSAFRRGVRWPGRYLWRSFLLFLDGVMNYVLIAEFDVLMGYAITGMIVAWLLLTSPAVQRGVIIICGALHLVFISTIAFFATGGASAAPPPTPYADGGFLDLARFRIEHLALFRMEMLLIGLLSIAMFLAGAHLLRAGVFAGEGAWLRRRLMIIGGIALPIDLALGVFGGTGGVVLQRYAFAPLVACGLLGLIAELCLRRGTAGPIAGALRDVGRVALSCYLAQNLLGGAIFYGWGLGLAVRLEPWRLWVTMGAYALIVGIMILFARAWMRYFRVGPVEWLWQRGAGLVPERPARTGSG